MPYLHSIPSSKERKVDGLLLRNVCIDERASIAVPGKKKVCIAVFSTLEKTQRLCIVFMWDLR